MQKQKVDVGITSGVLLAAVGMALVADRLVEKGIAPDEVNELRHLANELKIEYEKLVKIREQI